MGLYTLVEQASFRLAVWKIEEDESFFTSIIRSPVPVFSLPGRRVQFLASRYLFHVLGEDDTRLFKDEEGRPLDREGQWYCSLSHCPSFAAIALSSKYSVGVDIEPIRDKVQAIAPRFLLPNEYQTATLEQLMIYWSAKESLYKLNSVKGLDLRTQIRIDPFSPGQAGELSAHIIASNQLRSRVFYRIFENHVLTWAVPFGVEE